MADNDLCLYVDNSNIFHEGQRYAETQRGEDRYALRIHFANFLDLVLRGRNVREIVWGGSIPPDNDALWNRLKDLGVEADLIPRSDTGENETVDHYLQLRMFRHVRKYRDDPGKLVLCTGDGKGYANEDGFLFDLESHVNDGWSIEVISWQHSCHNQLRTFANNNGVFIPLDTYYDAITFIENGRRATGT